MAKLDRLMAQADRSAQAFLAARAAAKPAGRSPADRVLDRVCGALGQGDRELWTRAAVEMAPEVFADRGVGHDDLWPFAALFLADTWTEQAADPANRLVEHRGCGFVYTYPTICAEWPAFANDAEAWAARARKVGGLPARLAGELGSLSRQASNFLGGHPLGLDKGAVHRMG